MRMTTVSFVVPVRNEEEYIRACLQSLVDQDYRAGYLEIILVDGRSSDRTEEIIRTFCAQHEHVRFLDNPAGIVPVAMNIGIRSARGDIIIRADGHNVYPRNYAENCVRCLEETGADNVGGPWMIAPADGTLAARLVVAILSSPFGVGNSHFRTGDQEGFVDTVPFGAFRRELFDRIGMYDEKLVRNQDNELNARIRGAGGKIYLSRALASRYHPVKNLRHLVRQIFKTSQWHPFTIRQNKHSMGLRHLVPAAFVLVLAALAFASFQSNHARLFLASLLMTYFVVGWYFASRRSRDLGIDVTLAMPIACLCFHIAYGCGTLVGLRYLFKSPPSRPIREGLRAGH